MELEPIEKERLGLEIWKLINTYGFENVLETVLGKCSMLDFIDFMNKRAEEYKNEKTR